MRIGIIIETKEFEKAWNAFRFYNILLHRINHLPSLVSKEIL